MVKYAKMKGSVKLSDCELIISENELKPLKEIERSIQKKFRGKLWSPFIRALKDFKIDITITSKLKRAKQTLDEIRKILLLENFSEEEKDEKVFDLLREFLEVWDSLGDDEDRSKIILEAFWWKLFDALGHRPETMKCAKCGARLEEAAKKFFSAGRGGVVCETTIQRCTYYL